MDEMQYGEGIEARLNLLTRKLAIDSIRLVSAMRRDLVADVLARQLVRCATSVGANYRSACRARSKADMLSKLGVVEEEADECLYWLDLLVESGEGTVADADSIGCQAEQILRIVVASRKTLRGPKSVSEKLVRETLSTYRISDEDPLELETRKS